MVLAVVLAVGGASVGGVAVVDAGDGTAGGCVASFGKPPGWIADVVGHVVAVLAAGGSAGADAGDGRADSASAESFVSLA